MGRAWYEHGVRIGDHRAFSAISLRHMLVDYYVGNTGQVSFKVRFPFNAERRFGGTLCTLTGFNADHTVEMRISVFLESMLCDASDSTANVVLLLEHKLNIASQSLPDADFPENTQPATLIYDVVACPISSAHNIGNTNLGILFPIGPEILVCALAPISKHRRQN